MTDWVEQFLTLSPRAKFIAGCVLAFLGAGACVALWQRGWVVGWAIFALCLGLALLAVGRRELRQIRAVEGEMARARTEWRELERLVQTARREGQSVARLLQSRGYREFEVRRWIAKELGAGAVDG